MAPQRGKIELLLEPINATSGASPEEPFNMQPGAQVGVIGRTIEGDPITRKLYLMFSGSNIFPQLPSPN